MAFKRKRLLVDFDGVLHSYTGWNDGKLGPPIPLARHAMHILQRDFELICFTARADRPYLKQAVQEWLIKWGFPPMRVTNVKEPAHLVIDDRALRFSHWSDDFITRIHTFQAYWETLESPASSDTEPQSQQLPSLEIEPFSAAIEQSSSERSSGSENQ